jgi:hypothetical protein
MPAMPLPISTNLGFFWVFIRYALFAETRPVT